MRIWIIFLSAVLLFFIASSCEKNVVEPERPIIGWDYFPVVINNTWVYRVDSIVYSGFQKGQIDTFVYWIKEWISDDLSNDTAEPYMKVERYISRDSLVWLFDRNFSVKRNATYAIRTDNNGTEVKLSYPVALFKSWDANQFNNRGRKDYNYDGVFQPFYSGGIYYDSTISVMQEKEENFIQSKLVREVYAKNKGMVFKEFSDLNLEIITNPQTQKEDTTIDGLRLHYILVDFIR
jgi:hypothetical protein